MTVIQRVAASAIQRTAQTLLARGTATRRSDFSIVHGVNNIPWCRCFSSSIRHPPLSLGYMAGLQSASLPTPEPEEELADEMAWTTFDEAHELLQDVDPSMLLEFEDNLWTESRMKFVHATKQVSVMDLYDRDDTDDKESSNIVRSLVFNARPHLIQSSIQVEATSKKVLWGQPPPLVGPSATHLGGLALALPLWLAGKQQESGQEAIGDALEVDPNDNSPTEKDKQQPSVLVLGAGGCTIPSLLAKVGCHVTAIEPSDDVRHAAWHYFGAAEAGIELLPGLGQDYLRKQLRDPVDMLIVDAEDGTSAPPASMKEAPFWKDLVLPALKPGALVAVNVIGDPETERMILQQTIANALGTTYHVWCCEVPEIAQVSPRHCLLFATPYVISSSDADGDDDDEPIIPRIKEAINKYECLDRPAEWTKQIELARS